MMKPKTTSLDRRLVSRGFTLTELLVVILIVVVLAGLLFPLARNMRASATRTQCINQLRSWGVAFGGYAADHDGKVNWEHWPSIGTNPLQYSPYVAYWTGSSEDRDGFEAQLAQRNCPVIKYDKKKSNSPVTYSTIQPQGVSKVGITGRINGASSDYPLSRITKPSRFMLMIDTMPAAGTSGYSISTPEEFNSRVKPLTQSGPNLRHNRKVNALMADFAVREMTWRDIERSLNQWTAF